jgi:uncharacterized protein YtpQ (UPF0354 family)
MEAPSREEFADEVVRVIKAKFPLVSIRRAGDAMSLRLNGHTISLENLYRAVSYDARDPERQITRWVVELLRATEGRPDDEAGFEQVRDRIYPMLLPAHGRDSAYETAVHQPLIEGLQVAYAIDSDRTITYIPRRQFDKWGVSIDQLHEAAIANLVTRSSRLEVQAGQDAEGRVGILLIQTLDGYDASRLLLPTLHQQFREHLGSPFLAAIPNRDILVCCRNDPAMLDRVRQQAAHDFQSMPHSLTERLFLVTADGIAPFEH